MASIKEATIAIRILLSQKEMLQIKADEAGLSLSAYVRVLILKDLGVVK